jgi:GntR family transcriptional repressor for pyruvate dehydrogenase complex
MIESGLEYFEQIDIKNPAELIIEQIRRLITQGTLKPGTKLPSERALAERFGVGRGYIREALQKLEFYGILKTIPKQGTIVASIGVKALEGLISNILTMDHGNAESLMETRTVLEIHAARMAAIRGTEDDFRQILRSHEDFKAKAEKGLPTLDEDHVFHLTVAHAAKNSIANSLLGLIIPDVIAMNADFKEVGADRFRRTREEHEAIIQGIMNRDPQGAADAMMYHMEMSYRRRLIGKDPEWSLGFSGMEKKGSSPPRRTGINR